MEAKATRVRRLRIRRAIGRTATAVCLAAAVLLVAGIAGSATPVGGPSPAGHLKASLALAAGPAVERAPYVGIWVVEGSDAASVAADPAVVSVGQMPIRAAHVVVQGKDHDVVTNAATVRQLLSAMGIVPGTNDRVSPPPRTPLQDDMRVVFVKVTFGTERVAHSVPFSIVTQYTTDVPAGETQIVRGKPGKAIWTVNRRFENGHFVSREIVSKQIVRQPVDQVRLVGTFQPEPKSGRTQTGTASWYQHPGMTAASPWLPFGTHVTVTDLQTGKSIVVVIDDRGPFGGGIIDLSDEAFAELSPLGAGLIQVRLDW